MKEMNQLYEMMTNHTSIRAYTEAPVKEDDLHKIINAAIHGPSSINGQQWSVVVVKNQETKKKIADLTGGQVWIEKAPVFLMFVGDYYRTAKALAKQQQSFANMESIEATMVASVDAGIAFSSAMTMAESLGYGIVPIGSVRREPYQLIELLDLPEYVYPIVGMCIGVPAEKPGLKPRFPYQVMVHEEKYNRQIDQALTDYDQVIEEYMTQRTNGQDSRNWSQGVGAVYSRVYFPKVKGSLEQQGYTNTK